MMNNGNSISFPKNGEQWVYSGSLSISHHQLDIICRSVSQGWFVMVNECLVNDEWWYSTVSYRRDRCYSLLCKWQVTSTFSIKWKIAHGFFSSHLNCRLALKATWLVWYWALTYHKRFSNMSACTSEKMISCTWAFDWPFFLTWTIRALERAMLAIR